VAIKEESRIILPSKAKMAVGLAGAAAKQYAALNPQRSDAEIVKLADICRRCEQYVETSELGVRCKVCGCHLNIKQRWATAHCPLKQW
jgi:Zn finger protein HypA/HybF involved in hydrogenase expression